MSDRDVIRDALTMLSSAHDEDVAHKALVALDRLTAELAEEIVYVNRFALALRKIRRGVDHPDGRQGHKEFYEALEWASKTADEALGEPFSCSPGEESDPAEASA